MRNYFLLILGSIAIACSPSSKNKDLPDLLDLVFIDSVHVLENGFFLNGQAQVKSFGDSIVGVSSVKNYAVGFINLHTGIQTGQISSSDFPEAPFFPSAFDVSEFPTLYIADRYTNSILEFNVTERKFIRKIKLQVPNEKVIKLALGEFHKTNGGFLVELTTSKVDMFHPDYYQKSGNLIYLFDTNGDSIASFLEFPEVLKALERTINLEAFMESTFSENSFIYSFPQEKKIKTIEGKAPFNVLAEIDLPPSRYFDYGIKGFDKVISFDDIQNMDNVYFLLVTILCLCRTPKPIYTFKLGLSEMKVKG